MGQALSAINATRLRVAECEYSLDPGRLCITEKLNCDLRPHRPVDELPHTSNKAFNIRRFRLELHDGVLDDPPAMPCILEVCRQKGDTAASVPDPFRGLLGVVLLHLRDQDICALARISDGDGAPDP
jgi:hypothetical protein